MKRFSFEWRRAVFWLAIPALIVAVVVGSLAYRETAAEIEYRKIVNSLHQQSQPISNTDLATRHEQTTSSEGTAQWDRIAALTSAIRTSQTSGLPFFRGDIPLAVIAPGETWDQLDEVGEFLEMAEPVIELIEQAVEHPAPVWLPMHFEAAGTLFHPAYWDLEITQLLMLDVEHALWTKDMPRALRSIKLIANARDALNQKISSSSLFARNGRIGSAYAMIRRSFATGNLNKEQLDDLGALVGNPISMVDWPELVAGDVGFLIAKLESGGTDSVMSKRAGEFIARLPSHKLKALKLTLQLRDVPTESLRDFQRRVYKICTSDDAKNMESVGTLTAMEWQSTLVSGVTSLEDDRRMIEAAIAIKRFQLETGAFPELLADLDQSFQLLNLQEPFYQRDGDTATLSQFPIDDEDPANSGGGLGTEIPHFVIR